MSPYASYFLETLLLLVGVCVLAVVVLASGRKLGLGKAHGPLTLRGHLPLDARRAVYLVQAGDQVLVVGASESGLTKLGELAAADLAPERATKARTFAEWLRKDESAAEGRAKP